ncbi:MAG: Fe-S cluster assembly protein SufD [Pseudomonadota bacterium]
MTALRELIKDPTPAELELIARYGALPEDARRQRAFDAFIESGLPHRRLEAWKWTDIRGGLAALDAPENGPADDPFEGLAGPVFRFEDGRLKLPRKTLAGVRAFERAEAQALSGAEDMPLGALTAALAATPNALVLEITETVDEPVRFVFSGASDAAFARIMVVVRKGASVDIIESHLGGAGFSSTLIEFGLEDGANLSRTFYQSGGADEVQAVTATGFLGAGANYAQTGLTFGAKLARLETRLTHKGAQATATLNGAYLLAEGRHADFTSYVRHGAEAGVTRQTTKGAVKAGGRGVFQGKFHVPRQGQKTDAEMEHHALLLEPGAEVDAKPELEIYADDVACAHGNTAGALDADALFYMRQRGVPDADARALLTEAFIAEALEDAGDAEGVLLSAARDWLGGY